MTGAAVTSSSVAVRPVRQPAATAVALVAAAAAVSAVLFSPALDGPPTASTAPPAVPVPVAVTEGGASPSLAALAERDPGARVEVIVQLRRGADPASARALVREAGGRALRDVPIVNGLAARMQAVDALRILRDTDVRAVSLNGPVRPSGDDGSSLGTVFNAAAGTERLWEDATGRGVGVAIIDTGVEGDLPDFRRSSSDHSSRVIASAVIHPDATSAGDGYGHGTHVAGLVAGDGEGRADGDPLRGRYRGAAPDADLISVKVSDDAGATTVLDVIFGLQFAVDHRQAYNIRVVTLALSSSQAESYRTDPLAAAAEQAWLQGIVVVAAAGNRGSSADAVSYAPGNDPYVLTVGASDDRGTSGRSDDTVPAWSSRGTTQDGYAKPDVLAPGARLISTLAPDSRFTTLCPSCVTGDGYFRAGGTSMATAVAAGAAAAILEEHSDWTPDQVKGTIVDRARSLSGGGTPLIGADRAAFADGVSVANHGLEPNEAIDPATGRIAEGQASWSASWSSAPGSLSASWSRAGASWSCDCARTGDGAIEPWRASWSASWSAIF